MMPFIAVRCVELPEHAHTNPHLPRYFQVYVNEAGKESFAKGKRLPVGSMIVKEKYMAPERKLKFPPEKLPMSKDAKLELLTVMVKREKGIAPSIGDWEFYTANPDGVRTPKEDTKHCISCHTARPESDYTFADYLLYTKR